MPNTNTDMHRCSIMLCLVAACASLLAGCAGRNIRGQVERGIAESLPKRLGPAESYSVKVSGPTIELITGKISAVNIDGKGVELSNGMKIARLVVNVKDIRVDTRSKALKRCGEATYAATLSQEELSRYLVKKYPDVPKVKATLLKDRVAVSASPVLTGVTLNIKAEATAKIEKATLLALDLKKITVAGLPAPGFARDYIANKINPVFDATELGFDATISSVNLSPGQMTLAGGLDVAKAFKTDQPEPIANK